ncbi:MAG: nucleotidyltransferase domain-containing protein [Lachnospiraceae bacterium]|nr:nucleotidyltransferase domain-containing protein [Lachnospiraceae bacterium]
MLLNQEIINVLEAVKKAVVTEIIYLFGSHAYGTQNGDSDFDLFLVIPDDGIRPIDAMKQARSAMALIERKIPVDIIADYKHRFDKRKQYNTLERKIANDGLVLYER